MGSPMVSLPALMTLTINSIVLRKNYMNTKMVKIKNEIHHKLKYKWSLANRNNSFIFHHWSLYRIFHTKPLWKYFATQHRGTWTETNSYKKSLFFMFYQILRGVYTSNLFEICFIVANDDLKGKTTHFTGFYTNSISRPKILKPAHSVTQRDAIATAI